MSDEVKIGKTPMFVVTCEKGSVTEDTKKSVEAVLGKVAWLEYEGESRPPSVDMHQPIADASEVGEVFSAILKQIK